MRKRNEPKPIQGWGWLGDAAEEAAVEAMAPAGRSKNARAATAATKANRKSAAGRADVPAKHGMGDERVSPIGEAAVRIGRPDRD